MKAEGQCVDSRGETGQLGETDTATDLTPSDVLAPRGDLCMRMSQGPRAAYLMSILDPFSSPLPAWIQATLTLHLKHYSGLLTVLPALPLLYNLVSAKKPEGAIKIQIGSGPFSA